VLTQLACCIRVAAAHEEQSIWGSRLRRFGRIHHLPSALLTDLIDTMKDRGLVTDEARFTPAGRWVEDRVEALTTS
jgi:hypothetical protein